MNYYNTYGNYGYNTIPTSTQPFGYPFNPYMNYGQNYSQSQSNNQQQNQQSSVINTNKIFVSGIDDVKSKPLSANSDFIFLDNDKPILYQKTVDSKGKFEVKAFEINEIKPQEKQKEDNSINLSNYVTLTEFEAFKGQIDDLKNEITKVSLQNELNALNSQSKTKEKVEGKHE